MHIGAVCVGGGIMSGDVDVARLRALQEIVEEMGSIWLDQEDHDWLARVAHRLEDYAVRVHDLNERLLESRSEVQRLGRAVQRLERVAGEW